METKENSTSKYAQLFYHEIDKDIFTEQTFKAGFHMLGSFRAAGPDNVCPNMIHIFGPFATQLVILMFRPSVSPGNVPQFLRQAK